MKKQSHQKALESVNMKDSTRQPQERKRRFQLVKLEERIAPAFSTGGGNLAATIGTRWTTKMTECFGVVV
jgi:hypothetical protein